MSEIRAYNTDNTLASIAAERAPVEKKIEPGSPTEENLISNLEKRTAGDPDEADTIFTDLSPPELSARLHAADTPVGPEAILAWLEE